MAHRAISLGLSLLLLTSCDGKGPAQATSSQSGGGGHGGSSSASVAEGAGGNGASSSSVGGGGSGGGGFTPGKHAVPPLIPSQGGPVLAHLKLVTITFDDDPNGAMDEAYGDWVVTSSWLAAAQTDYGVGTGQHLLKVKLPGPAPATMTRGDIEALLVAKMTDATLPMPKDMGDEVYAVYFPAATTLLVNGIVHCKSFSGYHTEGKIGNVRFAFAAVGDCPSYVPALSEQENIMRTASHEIIEAATDPLISSARAYVVVDSKNPWYYFAGEVADVCPIGLYIKDSGFLAQRYWSNAAALAGLDPCIPAPIGEVYYSTSASPTDVQSVAPGKSVVFALEGWSAAKVAPWKLQATSILGNFNAAPALSGTAMDNGGTATLTLTVPAGTPPGSYALVALFSYHSSTDYHLWPVAIVAQ